MKDNTNNMEEINKEVGKRIKELREKKGESQTKLAGDIGLTQNSISKIEKGITMLTLQNLMLLADHFNVSYDYLCIGVEADSTLEMLKKYISFDYENITVGAEAFTCPILKINGALFDYLVHSARAQSDSYIPDDIRKIWLEKEADTFYEQSRGNKYVDMKRLVPLPQEFISPDEKKENWRQADLLRELNRQLLKDSN